MQIEPTTLPGVLLIRPRVFADSRGFFLESWRASAFRAAGLDVEFVQDNHSRSQRHTVRGLHYQVFRPQGKLVRAVRGAIFDVAVDMRRSSPTFGRWFGATLSDENHCALWVPPGFAHGFCALSEIADVVYKCTEDYTPEHDRAVRWDDPAIGIDWPLPKGVNAMISAKDTTAPLFDVAEKFA